MTDVHSASSIRAAESGAENGLGQIEPLIRQLLTELGEDPDREGLVRTPHRVENAMRFLTRGYGQTIEELVNGAIFAEEGSEMVVVKHIEFYSLCEHHMLPFFGKAHVGYISDGKIVGLSKIPRIVDMFARRLQVQERMTKQIAHALSGCLEPKGVAVVIEAHHFCMMMRGVEKQESRTTTSCMLGEFCDDDKTRAEFLNLIR